MSSSNHGGRRSGSGRKRGESSTVVRVPDGVLSEVRLLISKYKDSKLENRNVNQIEISNSNQVNLPNVDMGCPVDPKFKPRNPHPKNLEKRQRRKKNKK
ncbi:TPA: hypothetical protein ACVU44_004994 [Vibrio parahaemolyticus]